MRFKNNLFRFLLVTWISSCFGCRMEGVTTWFTPVTTEVLDTQFGSFFSRATENIVGINSITYGEGLNSGPYVQVTHSNSLFDITTNDAYRNYEENETAQSMTFTVVFGCTGGSTSTLVFIINIKDTNNNPPRFLPTDIFEFTVTPPLPPGYPLTGCLQDITVRDIDLTTQRIDFTIEPNDYFELDYDTSLSTDRKQFKAILRTTTFLRTLNEPVELKINATDVDLTGDPPITTTATIRIIGDSEYQLPEEIVFSQPYYLAAYEDDQISLDEPISLQQGYHELVEFSLEGDHSTYFDLQSNGSQLLLSVKEPLPLELLGEGQLILTVRAEREFTTGAAAAVLVSLPEVLGLQFENTLYEGTIVDGTMEPVQLVLTQGYEDGFTVDVIGNHSSLFATITNGNIITLSLRATPEPISNFISLQISASNALSTALSVVTLKVIFDDVTTPTFERTAYNGSYDSSTGLLLDQISLVQGYDETVSFFLDGEHVSYFRLSHEGPAVSITASPLSPELLVQTKLLLTVRATKPRTVGANTAIFIQLPPARELRFESSAYIGTIKENNLTLSPIVMSVGYDDDLRFSLSGDYASYFNVSNVQSEISLIQSTPLPQDIILSEDFLILTLSASGEFTETVSATVLLEIVKLDTNTPVFSQNVYVESYTESSVEIRNISLIQGYDSGVTFRLDGEHAQYFDIISAENNNVTVTMTSNIPESLIFDEKVLFFTIKADKPLAVGANAVIAIKFPGELTELAVMKFTQNAYIGVMENNVISLENITLESGFSNDTEFFHRGEYAEYFTIVTTERVVTISMIDAIPEEVLNNTRNIVLELEARRKQSVSAIATILIEVVYQEVEQPLFEKAYYRHIYTEGSILQFEHEIALTQGFDETVTFSLEGDSSIWFSLSTNENSIALEINGTIPTEVVESNYQLLFTILASKPGVPPGRAVISVELPKDMDLVILRFEQNSYVGRIESGELQSPSITLLGENTEQPQLTVSGEYAAYFTLSRESNNIMLQLNGTLPNEIEDAHVILNIEASSPNAISGYTTVILEVARDPVSASPMFEQAYYVGEYSKQDGLLFEHNLQLIDGFGESVTFTLEGDDAQWFEINNSDESLSLTLTHNGTLPMENRNQLIFSVVAKKLNSLPGRAAIIIILSDYPKMASLHFSEPFYKGTIGNGKLTMEAITLDGYSADTNISIAGDYVNYFQLLNQEGTISILLNSTIPNDVIDSNTVLILTLEARTLTLRSQATLIIELLKKEISLVTFEETYYVGSYSESQGFLFNSQISLANGYEDSVSFYLDGADAQWFNATQDGNSLSLQLATRIPQEVLLGRRQLIFTVVAENLGSIPVRASVFIELLDEHSNDITFLMFESRSYMGSIENNLLVIEPINLQQGYSEDVEFSVSGDLSEYFAVSNQETLITIRLVKEIPKELLPANKVTFLVLEAWAPNAYSAYATIALEFINNETVISQMTFSEPFYTGSYSEVTGLIFDRNVSLDEGYDHQTEFILQGDSSVWFELKSEDNAVSLILISPIPLDVLSNNHQLIFLVTAKKLGNVTASATIVISLTDDFTEEPPLLGFNKISYLGSIENDQITLEQVILSEEYTENVTVTLHGDFSKFFTASHKDEVVTILLEDILPAEIIPENQIVILEIQASAPQSISAFATVVFHILHSDSSVEDPIFSEVYYTGKYTEEGGLDLGLISLSHGYDDNVSFALEGDQSQWFSLNVSNNSVKLAVSSIPQEILENNRNLIFTIIADKPGSSIVRAVIIIALPNDVTRVSFERALYGGGIREGRVRHETIILSGYNGTEVQIYGTYAELFLASVSERSVTVEGVSSVTLAPEVAYVPLELRAADATTVLVLDVKHQDAELPTVTFGSTSYSLRADITQSGFLGRVEATASNGEALSYSLLIRDGYKYKDQVIKLLKHHLRQRITVTREGDIYLSAPAYSGLYNFEVVATTVFSKASDSANVQLTVEIVATCGDDKVLPPLIVLDRNEEQPHKNLIVMNEDHEGCRYRLNNRWPADQTWLYVDDVGLHANSIDREDSSIAFMALSQVQVELLLECDYDNATTRSKRSASEKTHLGPYDYGDKNWILTDSILYNSRRTLVNLIVNDINDNYPIFVCKDNEPIIVGYPLPEIEERVSPKALIKLEATDADVGENAALVYWSPDEALAVSPSSGLVHVRANARLRDGDTASVFATDQNGQGLSGNLTLLVRLLDASNIAVVTIKDAFLEDERDTLASLSTSVGYEVKALRATVVSDSTTETASRRIRDATAYGASLQIYVYGIIDSEPVLTVRLIADLTNDGITTVNITRTVSLEDHLEEMRDSSGRDTGLLVATIVLSVLLFILIVAAAVCFFLKWRKDRNYNKFRDENSVASVDETRGGVLKPEAEVKARMNIEELKRSERRLQERLQVPVKDAIVEPNSSKRESSLSVEAPASIVIKDKLKLGGNRSEDDEFGETSAAKRSVVRFDGNFEKIIHVEETPDGHSSNLNVHKF